MYIKSILQFFLELLFPSRCLGCGSKKEILCDSCMDKLPTAERETESSIFAVYDYRDPLVKKLIWELKYHHLPYLGQKLGDILYSSLIEEINEIRIFSSGCPIIVIPVPISKERRRLRGYNQSEIIAKNFCNSSLKGIFEFNKKIIYKKLNTTPQAKLTNRNRRLQNIKGAFGITKSENVKDKTIIVIDDVTTTGGTINEIIKLLKKSGAKKIIGFAVAH